MGKHVNIKKDFLCGRPLNLSSLWRRATIFFINPPHIPNFHIHPKVSLWPFAGTSEGQTTDTHKETFQCIVSIDQGWYVGSLCEHGFW